MKSPGFRLVALGAGLVSSAAVASAHPGHDGHELTWDLGHLAAHPVATVVCIAVLAAGVAGAWLLARRLQTLRGSQARRGK